MQKGSAHSCSHVRVRNYHWYQTDVDGYLQFLESKFNIKISSIHNWEDKVRLLHVAKTEYKRKLQLAALHKALIVKKLLVESARMSPFEMTDQMIRTREKWEKMNHNATYSDMQKVDNEEFSMSSKLQLVEEESSQSDTTLSNSISKSTLSAQRDPKMFKESSVLSKSLTTGHPNSLVDFPIKPVSKLPLKVSQNVHYLLSQIGSEGIYLDLERERDCHELRLLKQSLEETTLVSCVPKEINIINMTLDEQKVSFSLLNSSNNWTYVKFSGVTDIHHFCKAEVYPFITVKLYPGMQKRFTFFFKLANKDQDFSSMVTFKVEGRRFNGLAAVTETLRIPTVCNYHKVRSINVSEVLEIPAFYMWHMKSYPDCPKALISVSVADDYWYHMHVVKHKRDLANETDDVNNDGMVDHSVSEETVKDPSLHDHSLIGVNSVSVKELSTKTMSIKKDTGGYEQHSPLIKSMKKSASEKSVMADVASSKEIHVPLEELEPAPSEVYTEMTKLLDHVIERALDIFFIETTYLFLEPGKKYVIPVYFTRAPFEGYHLGSFELHFYDGTLNERVLIKRTTVFAQVLGHPIRFHPEILDLSHINAVEGFCKGNFDVQNNHRIYPVAVSIAVPYRVSKLIEITPMNAVIPNMTTIPFTVRFCKSNRTNSTTDVIYCKIQITIKGKIFKDVPVIIYELILPLVEEYNKLFKKPESV